MKYLILAMVLITNVQADVIKVKVKGLVCSSCSESLEAKLKKNSAVKDVAVNLDDFLIKINTHANQSSKVSDKEIKDRLLEQGYLTETIERKQCEKC